MTIGLGFLEANLGIVDLNKTLSLNGRLIPTELCKDRESQVKQICRATLPSSLINRPNTICNLPVVS